MHEEEGYQDLVKAIRLNERSRLGRYFLAKYWRERGQIGIAMKYLESLGCRGTWREPLANRVGENRLPGRGYCQCAGILSISDE